MRSGDENTFKAIVKLGGKDPVSIGYFFKRKPVGYNSLWIYYSIHDVLNHLWKKAYHRGLVGTDSDAFINNIPNRDKVTGGAIYAYD